MPSVLKETGVILLPQVAKRVAILYRAAIRAVGEPGEKILQRGRPIGTVALRISCEAESIITGCEIEYASASGTVAQVRPEKERFRAKLEGMLAAQKRDVIHNIIVFARAIVFRQILIAA